MSDDLKVMVVDDTITYRMIMKKVAESIPGIRVTGTASNGKLALDKLTGQIVSKAPDCPEALLLDVEMPVMDGITTLKKIRTQFPNIIVIMVSALSRSNANIIVECLNAGALDFITKPLESNVESAKKALREDLEPIFSLLIQERQKEKIEPSSERKPPPKAMQARTTQTKLTQPQRKPSRFSSMPTPTVRASMQTPKQSPPTQIQPKKVSLAGKVSSPPISTTVARSTFTKFVRPDLVLIGSSTGGPAALTKLLGGIKQTLSVPVVIVQHMPPIFTASLAAQLSRTSGHSVKEAVDDQTITPGSITLAMGGRHMTLLKKDGMLRVRLNDGPKVNECRPAVDVLFMSVAAINVGTILSVILTGMGRDGANGVDALKRMGKTQCITQNKQSCIVYGMPRSVDEKGLSDMSLPLEEIGPKIAEICSGSGGLG